MPMLHGLAFSYVIRAITHGIGHIVGSVAVGQLADLVLWRPENFGAKPELVLKGGSIAWAQVDSHYSSCPSILTSELTDG